MSEDIDLRLRRAVQSFWETRHLQATKQASKGRVDAGTRGAVTGGAQMGAIEALIVELLCEVGMTRAEIRTRKALELPGYFRPEKKWDVLVIADKTLVAAVEFKSQVGSIGNNFNNRAEESIGNAVDLWTAYREGRFGSPAPAAPFVGFFFLLEDTAAVQRPVRNSEPHYRVDPVFSGGGRGVSYAKRYELLLQRLVAERTYSGACLTLTTGPGIAGAATAVHPNEDLSFKRFVAGLQGHAIGFQKGR